MESCLKIKMRLWRARAGLTLQEVADLTGYSEGTLSRVERGERRISPQAKVHIARCLGCRVADLFDVEAAPDAEVVGDAVSA